jgi:hypothetical protein
VLVLHRRDVRHLGRESGLLSRVLRRTGRLFLVAVFGLLLGVLVWWGLIQLGLARNPFAPVTSGELALARSDRPGLRVLFVGNSFTAENSLPELVYRLSASDKGARRVFAVGYTAGGSTLRRASHEGSLTRLLRKVRWDVVVLQEQSRIPSLSVSVRYREMVPAALTLETKIRDAGAEPLLFMTWGYKSGDGSGDTYSAMQARIAAGYEDLAEQLHARVAPVGIAWEHALQREPGLQLWAGDGRHPSLAGSYLAACVFYGELTGRPPTRIVYLAGLPSREARFLQNVAADVVTPTRT